MMYGGFILFKDANNLGAIPAANEIEYNVSPFCILYRLPVSVAIVGSFFDAEIELTGAGPVFLAQPPIVLRMIPSMISFISCALFIDNYSLVQISDNGDN